MDSKISVIIPIYNVEEYLERCVESVVNQTYKNLEILLIDDGSPDKCYKICDDWAKKDKRIKVVHKENGGLSDARNVGIRYSTGKYLCFIDSDDCIDENYIQYMYQAIKDNCSDIAICKFRKFSDVKTLETIQDDPNVQILDNRSLIFKLFESDNIHFISACTKLYDKNIFYDLEFDIGKLHEDEYIVHKIFAKCKTAVYVPLPLYNYYEREGSITKTKTFREKNLDAFYSVLSRYEFFKGSEFEQKSLNQLCNNTAYVYCVAKSRNADKKMIKFLKKQFNVYYKLNKNKTLKQFAFRYMPGLSCFIMNLRHK